MKEEWLLRGAVVPVDVETTAALAAEIKRLIDVVGGMALAQPEQAPVTLVVSTAPDRIWLDLGFDPQDEYEIIFHELHDVTWSQDNASGNGIEYVRRSEERRVGKD